MMELDEFFSKELANAGYNGVALQKTPLGTRITVRAARPGIVIGKRGSNVKQLTVDLGEHFGIENPSIDVEQIDNPELNAQIMADRLAQSLEKGKHYRRAAYGIVRRVMRSGARGIEISVSGKVTSQRARNQHFKEGVISKCGTPAVDAVDKGVAHCMMKPGVLGVIVKIMPLDYEMPDQVLILDKKLAALAKSQEEVEEVDDLPLADEDDADEDDEDEEDDEDLFADDEDED